MFIRKRRYTHRGYGSPSWRSYAAGKVVSYYQALESVRVDGKPKHQVIASWSGHRSLAAAVEELNAEVAEMSQELNACRKALAAHAAGDRLACRRVYSFARKPHVWALKTVTRLERELPSRQAKLDGLRRAREILGDWQDDQP